MEFSSQEHWSELPFPTPGDLPDAGIEPASLVSLEWAGGVFTTVPPVKPPPTTGRDIKNPWKVLADGSMVINKTMKGLASNNEYASNKSEVMRDS